MVATVLVSINLLVCAEYSNVFKAYGRSQKHSHCQVIHLLSLLVYDFIHLHLIFIFYQLGILLALVHPFLLSFSILQFTYQYQEFFQAMVYKQDASSSNHVR